MIAALTGRVLHISDDRVVVDVMGVGYEVFLSADGLAKLPEKNGEVMLHIHTQVREDAITLYGFMDIAEKEMFLVLKSVSGIGPKLALAMLSGMHVQELGGAIAREDAKLLTSLPGIGKKTAERICVELKDKMGNMTGDEIAQKEMLSGISDRTGGRGADALSALVNLGYPDPVARQVLSRVKQNNGEDNFNEMGVEDIIREALRILA